MLANDWRRRPSGPAASASRTRCLNAGSDMIATRSASGRPAISRYTGLVSSGCSVHSSPNTRPTGRGATWPVIGTPAALASPSSSSSRRQAVPRTCSNENESGRPDRSAIRRNIENSPSTSLKSETTCSTPRPLFPISSAIPISSSASAVSVGVNSPRLVRWFIVRDVVKPSAPASIAPRASRAIASMSSVVAASRRAPRSPMTCSRSAPCGTCTATSTSNGRPSSASTNSGNDCHDHVSPSCSTVPGMSSTPSMSSMSRSWSAGRTGANPTPQLPTTTVVTPCHDDGIMRSPHDA